MGRFLFLTIRKTCLGVTRLDWTLRSYLVVEAVAAPELCGVEGNLQSRRDGAQTALDQIREKFGLTVGWTLGQHITAERQITDGRKHVVAGQMLFSLNPFRH